MAVKITNTLGDLSGAILENAATEETLKELLDVMKEQARPGSTKGPLAGLENSAKKASSALDEFSDELDDASNANSRTLKNFAKGGRLAVASLDAVNRGLRGISGSSDTAQGQIQQFGGMAAGTLAGVGQAATSAGVGLAMVAPQARLASGALAVAGTALGILGNAAAAATAAFATIIGMVQGFQQTFVQVNQTGFVLDSSFGELITRTHNANLTLAQFAGVVERNRTEFAYFAGSVNQGTNRILALRSAMSDDVIDGFINMGIGLENIPDALASYLSLLGRSGRQMAQNDQMAIDGATRLFQQQRLLANLTGQSVDAIRAEAMERTRATRVQASFNEMVPGARDAYAAAAGAVSGILGPQLAQGFEAIFAGDIADPMYQAIMGAAPGITRELESLRDGIATGAITPEEAQRITLERLQAAGPMIERELNTAAEFARFSVETPFHQFTGDLGFALDRIRSIMEVDIDQLEGFVRDQFTGLPAAGESADTMLESFRNVERGSLEVQLALQGIAATITETVGAGPTGLFARFASSMNEMVDAMLHASRDLTGIRGVGPDGVVQQSRLSRAMEGAQSGAGEGALAGGTVGIVGGPKGILGGALIGGTIGGVFGFFRSLADSADTIASSMDNMSTDQFIDPYSGLIPEFARGGVFSAAPTGSLAMLHGTEAVVPLPDGQSIPVNLNQATGGTLDELSGYLSAAIGTGALVDNSKSMPELVRLNRSLVSQNYQLVEKFDQLVRAMNESNAISRSSAMARA
jgi:hypothetical protein